MTRMSFRSSDPRNFNKRPDATRMNDTVPNKLKTANLELNEFFGAVVQSLDGENRREKRLRQYSLVWLPKFKPSSITDSAKWLETIVLLKS